MENEIIDKMIEAIKIYYTFLLKLQFEEPEIKFQNQSIKIKGLPQNLSEKLFEFILKKMLLD